MGKNINLIMNEFIKPKNNIETFAVTSLLNGTDKYFTYTFMEDSNSYSIKLTSEYTAGDMIIPSTYNNYNVTIIEDNGFLF